MSLSKIEIMYGKLEGAEGKFARDPTGYLAIEAGIFHKNGLNVSWQHVQGTEERYRRLESGTGHISFVVGRAALHHFINTKTTRILGSSMNRCPYYLVVNPAIKEIKYLKGGVLACRENTARIAPLVGVFQERADLSIGEDVTLDLTPGDQEAFDLLLSGTAQAAFLPRQYGFIAEDHGFRSVKGWDNVVDDPLPIMIETTEALLREKEEEFLIFIQAHKEGIRYLKSNRTATICLLEKIFGHSSTLAAKTFDDYLVYLDDRMTVDLEQLEKLLSMGAPEISGNVRQLASEWILPWALTG